MREINFDLHDRRIDRCVCWSFGTLLWAIISIGLVSLSLLAFNNERFHRSTLESENRKDFSKLLLRIEKLELFLKDDRFLGISSDDNNSKKIIKLSEEDELPSLHTSVQHMTRRLTVMETNTTPEDYKMEDNILGVSYSRNFIEDNYFGRYILSESCSRKLFVSFLYHPLSMGIANSLTRRILEWCQY